MARGKQTRQRQQQSSRQNQDQESNSSLDQSKLNEKEELAQLYRVDFDEEVPRSSNTSTIGSSLRDVFCLLFCLVGVGTIAVAMGLGAGMAVSIQFYEGPNTDPLFQNQPARPYKRVTGWDKDILSKNVIQKQGSDSSRVVTQTKSTSLLSIVEETSLNDDSARKKSESTSFDIGLSEATILPKLCPDGLTMGFNDWSTLKSAIHEANSLSAERFLRWNEYFASLDEDAFPITFEDGMLYYEEDAVFTICPGAILKARQGPIFVNAENVMIRCVHCTIQVGGSHLSFGPHAKHVLIRGVAFTGAELSSLTFYHDGADVSFEDCSWRRNWGGRGDRGEIADMNSTSAINFYRCDIRTESPTAVRVHGIGSRI